MSTAENIALERRVETLERQLIAAEPVRIKTILRVCERGDEEPCRTVEDVYRLAKFSAPVRVVEEIADLDVLIEPGTGSHLSSADVDDAADFEALAAGVRVIEIVIECYEAQRKQIVSCAPVTESKGGARAGKTRIVVWWLLRQWLLRGHGVDDENPKPAVLWWIREDSEKLYEHAIQWLLSLWPRELFVGKLPTRTTKKPTLTMLDGTVVAFRHANFSGRKAGTNLRSADVEACVIDELSAITNEENYREILNRLGTTGGRLATAYTPVAGHWCAGRDQGGSGTSSATVGMWDNPWWSYAKIWLAFLRAEDLTDAQMVDVLNSPDPVQAADDAIQDPRSRARYFGEEHVIGLTLWREWDAQRFTVRGPAIFGREFELGGVRLPNITAPILGQFFGRPGRMIDRSGGIDFNINPGVAVIFQVFGTLERPVVVVLDEVISHGPTITAAKNIRSRHPGLCAHCDPTGAMDYRHASHGAKNMSDAEEMRAHGLEVEAAAGYSGTTARHLSQLDSINAMHRAMALGLLRVHERCIYTLKALREMRANSDGTIKKTSGVGSVSDQTSGPGDALRYGVWRVWELLIGSAA